MYTSISNSVEIALPHRQHEKSFLIYFVVKGCPEPELSSAYWFKRKYDEVLVGCKSGSDTWTMKCLANQWTGNIGNCSGEASVAKNQTSLWPLPIFSGVTIAIIITLSLLISGVILMSGIIYMRRNKDNKYGDDKSVRHIEEMPYSHTAKMKAMEAMDADNNVNSFCEQEYTHTWGSYPTHLYGQYGGRVLVSNSGLYSLYQQQECDNIYDTVLGSGYSRPTGTTVTFANRKNLTDCVNTVNELREDSVPAITNGEATSTTNSTDSLITANYNMK